jgi:ATP-dependent RNA helicase MSS116
MDVIGRAHTGTGKTLAYLLPSLDRLYRERDEEEERQRQNGRPLPKRGVRMLVLSPTRELARQIYREALHLGLVTQRNDENRSKQGSLPNTDADSEEFAHATHGTDRDSGATSHSADFGPGKEMASGAAPLVCQVIHGGVPKRADVLGFRTSIPDVLISTPGRLLDHLKNTHVSSSKDDKDDDKNENDGRPFSSWLQSVRVLVVDEVDRLLDMGFREDINTIVERLPSSESRQTLLLSATLPSEVRKLMLQHVHPTIHVVVDCTQDFLGGTTATWDDGSYEPPATAADTIDQTYAVLPTQRVVSGVVELILHLQKSVGTQGRNKVLVFFPTTSQVIFYSCLLNHHLGRHAWEMHSEMSQMRRMVVSDAFRDAPFGGVMLTSDVSARGVDYPGVTHVVQVGVSRDRETYLHRIGRTGRAGKHGKGILLVLEPERDCLVRDLSGLSIRRDARLQRLLDHPPSRRLRSDLLQISHSLRTGNADDLMESAEACYRSLLSYYYSRLGVNKRNEHARIDAAVDIANSFAHQSGMADLPTLPVKLATQCGLLNHPRLNIDQRWTLGSRFDVGAGMISSACDVGEGDFNVTASAESAELWSQEQHVD